MTGFFYLDPHPAGTPGVLLLHGLGANGSSWGLQFAPLIQAGFRPLAPDAPGFGETSYDGRGWNFKRIAADLAALIGELGLGPAHIVGISMGGVIALQFALDYPGLVRKLALVNTFAILRPAHWTGYLYFLQRLVMVNTVGLPTQARFVAKRIFPQPDQEPLRQILIEQVTKADPRAYRAAMLHLGLFNVVKRLDEIKAPTLVITAQNDTTVDPLRQKALVDGIAGARQIVIPGAGHAVSVDQPGLFNQALMEFLLN
ncbi:MAG: alpha/beta hydrolase [Chloroflexi bacterium]|nr:MAG: alpha/beta hydrolase [Chloroflexota bacterium]